MKLIKCMVFLLAAVSIPWAQGAQTANAVKTLATQAAASSSTGGSQSSAAPVKPAPKPTSSSATQSSQSTAAPVKSPKPAASSPAQSTQSSPGHVNTPKPAAPSAAANNQPAAKAPTKAAPATTAASSPAAKPSTKPVSKSAGAATFTPATTGKTQAKPAKTKPATLDSTAQKKSELKKSSLSKPVMPETPELAQRVSLSGAAGRRDPFISPIVRATGRGPGCQTGKKCLMIDQIALKGIVKSQNGMIAVVENSAHRAYFLRETDPVFNGVVEKITGDSVVFRETVTDKLGKETTREVVKRVNAPIV